MTARVSSDPVPANNGLFYLHTDHLGSTSLITNSSGQQLGDTIRYYPFGEDRTGPSTGDITDRGFTGHKHNDGLGLIYMQARYYVPGVGRFVSADTVVPDGERPQSFNRYSYTSNNPLNYVDPTGHKLECSAVNGGCEGPPPEPWLLTDELLDINDDGIVSEREALMRIEYYKENAGAILMKDMVMPADSDFGPFGGPITRSCGIAGRPPCDARHPAVDTYTDANNLHDSVYAVAYGTVVRVGYAADGFGNYVLIEHDVYGVSLYSLYAHNDSILVAEGATVGPGTRIAWMGDTHNQNSVHLHFEIRRETNVDLSQDQPFAGQVYWPTTLQQLSLNFVDMGPVFGYHASYSDWTENSP